MFYIQRASAGSGKTYTLTKRFILHLIANKSEKGKWYLRSEKEIEDKMSSVLAITFTNKATNEMKERIVEKLSELAKASEESNLIGQFIVETSYLEELAQITGSSFQNIGKACKAGLNAILNNFSLFNVSTIDSFFQDILRTFAFEANVNDSYQLEIDSDYLNKSALDLTLQELDTDPRNIGNASFWIKILMGRTSQINHRWNVFTKSENSQSIYYNIKDALKKLNSEEFKTVKQSLDNYFSNPEASDNLKNLYNDLQINAKIERNAALSHIQNLIRSIDSKISSDSFPVDQVKVSYFNHKQKIEKFNIYSKVDFSLNSVLKEDGSILKNKIKGKFPELEKLGKELYENLEKWDDWTEFPFYSAWKVYGDLLPYMGLVLEISNRMIELLQSTNSLQISDTNFLLKKIIGKDDTPFVYERMGNYINNFLIDEFQDTSEMQWDILRPLLTEGDSKGQDSLIIGDPKQSIYRFRNAKYSLILNEAPSTFHTPILLGMNSEENTNWRSHENIVRFNNYFFKSLSRVLSYINKKKGITDDLDNLYLNVVQYPHKKDKTGYVEIRFSKLAEFQEDSNGESQNSKDTLGLGELISSLCKRGYKSKDIAILVSSNAKGRVVVESLMEYNQGKSTYDKISFISEDSLLISKSNAVQLVIGVLEKIADKNFVDIPKDDKYSENQNPKKSIPWNQIRLNFHLFSLQHPGLSASERMLKFLNQDHEENVLYDLLGSIQIATLSVITDAIIDKFVEEDLREKDSLYLASFQDLINEYSGKYSNDPSSFIEWWKAKGQYRSVSSPENTDSVQILTIHKSKGLEFKCVILPWASDSFIPDNKKLEWRWVKPVNPENKFKFPPYLPINTKSDILDSWHADTYQNYYSQVTIDKLNMYYVAFTRAKNELYILTGNQGNNQENLCRYLNLICNSDYKSDFFTSEENELILRPESFIQNKEKLIVTFGEKLTKEQISQEYETEHSENLIHKKILKGYFVNTYTPRLNFVRAQIDDNSDL